MNICVIPARGNSKRIPKKNIKNFLGKPIIAYSIKIALDCKIFDKVIVSTDSKEISKIANYYGAETPFIRPKKLSNDYIGTHEVIGHAIKWMESKGQKIKYCCCIYPTAPLIEKKDILNGYKLIKNQKWDAIIAATNFSYPVYRSFKKLPNGGLKMLFPKFYNSRSQDLPETYHDAGLFYWSNSDNWKKKPKTFNDKISIVKIPNYRVQDIDIIDDWKKAELLYKILKKNT